jgi:hypothetical protein
MNEMRRNSVELDRPVTILAPKLASGGIKDMPLTNDGTYLVLATVVEQMFWDSSEEFEALHRRAGAE